MSLGRNAIVRWLWQGLKLALVVAVVGYVIYLVRFSPMPVTGHQVEHGEIAAEVMGTGTLEARVRVTISPKISGRIEEILADEGDRLSKGDALVRLNNDELTQQVEIAQATLAVSQAAVERLKTDRGRGAPGDGAQNGIRLAWCGLGNCGGMRLAAWQRVVAA